jgi:hypothetical protein
MIPLVYIAGPFTGPTAWDIAENVQNARRYGLEIARVGGMPVIPHANTSLFHGQCTAEFWYEGTLRLLQVCDVLVLIPGWEGASGSRNEKEWWEANRGCRVESFALAPLDLLKTTEEYARLKQYIERCRAA